MKTQITVSLTLLCIISVNAQTDGFYKDLFMDGGVHLTSRTTLPAAEGLNLDMEFIASEDTILQRQIIIKNDFDQNGFLLYPDGAPRYKAIYTNGGSATNHGNSLGESGRNRIRQFYYNGGSFTGSCAGAFIASLSYMATGIYEPYYHIWPGRTEVTGVEDTYTGHAIPVDSPLLNYFTFGGDFYISNVRHNGGCSARENIDFPAGTEILLRYDYPGFSMHEKASCWAYKENEQSGRVVLIGSHPESVTSGERLNLMEAILLYALDGTGDPQIKGMLTNGQTRYMNKTTEENDPAFTKIGDRQYHHFTVDIPENVKNFNIEVTGDDGFDLYLYINKNNFAFEEDAAYALTDSGAQKKLTLSEISAGLWYIGIHCATTVQTIQTYWGYNYIGDNEVLNGVAYTVTASWETDPSGFSLLAEIPDQFMLYQNTPNPFNPSTSISFNVPHAAFVRLTVYNTVGQQVALILEKNIGAGLHQVQFDASGLPSGIYFYCIQAERFSQTKKMILVR